MSRSLAIFRLDRGAASGGELRILRRDRVAPRAVSELPIGEVFKLTQDHSARETKIVPLKGVVNDPGEPATAANPFSGLPWIGGMSPGLNRVGDDPLNVGLLRGVAFIVEHAARDLDGADRFPERGLAFATDTHEPGGLLFLCHRFPSPS